MLASPGERVEAGQPLVVLESSELGKARAAHRWRARARCSRARRASASASWSSDRIAARRELQEAEAELEAAEAELRAAAAQLSALGVAPSEFVAERGGDARFTLRSPLAGTVLERQVAQGRVAEPGQALFRIADLARLWLVVHAFERDAVRVQAGSPARVTFSALPGRTAAGTVRRIGSQVDTSSRTIPIRIDVENPDGALRPGMSATAWLPLGDAGADAGRRPGGCAAAHAAKAGASSCRAAKGASSAAGSAAAATSAARSRSSPGSSRARPSWWTAPSCSRPRPTRRGGEGAQHAH